MRCAHEKRESTQGDGENYSRLVEKLRSAGPVRPVGRAFPQADAHCWRGRAIHVRMPPGPPVFERLVMAQADLLRGNPVYCANRIPGHRRSLTAQTEYTVTRRKR